MLVEHQSTSVTKILRVLWVHKSVIAQLDKMVFTVRIVV